MMFYSKILPINVSTTHDNIMIEIFFGRMKVEMFYGKEKTFKDLNDLEKAIKDYINWYNSDVTSKFVTLKVSESIL